MDNTPPAPAVLHIEVQLLPGTVCENRNDLETTIRNWLLDNFAALSLEQVISDFEGSKQLESTIERLMLTEASIEARNPKSGRENIDTAYLEGAVLNLHVYSFQPQASPTAPLAPRGDGDDDELSWIPSSRIIELPARSLDGVWEALVYESNIKSTLLGYLQTLGPFKPCPASLQC